MRRADPAKRNRAEKYQPPKPIERESEAKTNADKPKVDSRPGENNARDSKPENTRQRNHRHDGKLYENQQNDRQRAQHSPNAEPKPPKPAGIDTRSSPKASRDEPQYRQTPRRGGKLRDENSRNIENRPFNKPQANIGISKPLSNDGFEPKHQSKPLSNDGYESAQAETSADLPRLSKLMTERGLCSRREADDWIANGWVKVDGEIIETLGTRVAPNCEIAISGYATQLQDENVTILLNKPIGFVSGQAEDDYEPAIVLVHPDNEWVDDFHAHNDHHRKQFHRGFLKGLAPAGRLDIDSTGLLVLTQDGRVAKALIGENSTIEKEYLVRVEGNLSAEDLTKLNFGLSLDGVKLKPAKVSWQNEDQLRFVLREGKKRQIRRMCEMVGLHVVGLKRIRIGSVNLGKLPEGQWRYLRSNERF